jgi:hypothetical protein
VLTSCGTLNAKGGLYYSIGPFTAPGTLILTTSGASNCQLGSDTLLALFDITYRPQQSPAPTCISYNDDSIGSYCSSIRFQVGRAYVRTNTSSGGQLLVRVGLYNDATTAVFKQAITFTTSYTCTTPAPASKLPLVPATLPSLAPQQKRKAGAPPSG